MKAFTALILISLVVSPLIFALPTKAQEPLNLTIKPDGTVEPNTNLLERNGTKYTFKGDIFGAIMVKQATSQLTAQDIPFKDNMEVA
jgi:hypothetical protein